jgi:hypothetical protein
MAIAWTKTWAPTDDGTLLAGRDLRNIQDDVNSYLGSVPLLTTANQFTGANKFGSLTNYTQIDAAGHMTMVGNATTFEDLIVPLTSTRVGASTKPDFDETNVAYLFPQNDATEKLFIIVQFPHAWKEGSTIHPHIHWQQASSSNVTWKIDYKWFNINAAVPGAFTTLTMDTLVNTYVSGSLHQISKSSAGISGTGLTMSSIMLIKLYRQDNTYTGDAAAWQFDIHYERDSLGSNAEYVKA